jgi:UDP-N-acetylglucosamine 2-epimerase (non-hydrolysing)/GDP/UDP-N,N'-diacetylbacillosamine 2-epimerase (hydrolysing)
MSTRRNRICVVTGSRAEYGLLYWVLHDLLEEPALEVSLVVTGMHLAPEFGFTVREIERDGFEIARRVEMLIASDTRGGVAKSVGLGVIGLSGAYEELRPDIVLVLGDRVEILAAVQAALIHRIPVAHVAGGDTSEGAIDECLRHAITKMSHVHFVTNEQSAARVRQLGEDPARIHVVGSPGLDHLRRRPLLDRGALQNDLGAGLAARNLLITFHPVTVESDNGAAQFVELLAALDTLPSDIALWFTYPNADAGGRELATTLEQWVRERSSRARVHPSLGQLRYLSLMAQVDAVVGNSSSGLYEAPSFGIHTVDIGNRQQGRLAASSVRRVEPRRADIRAALDAALKQRPRDVVNPYGDGRSAGRIVAILRELKHPDALIHKPFHESKPA